MTGVDVLLRSLRGPVEVELARLAETIPAPRRMAGGSVYELKWDGYRMVIVRETEAAQLWSRNGKNLTDRFPDVAAAATAQLPVGTVVDGEVVVWDGNRLSFDLLQGRLVSGPARARGLAGKHPASFIAFDLLADHGSDQRTRLWSQRRHALEALASDWRPPLQLSPYTRDKAEAERWFVEYRPTGIEGLVVKGAATAYEPGRRGWVKVKNRETREVIVGAIVGTLQRPDAVIAGLHDANGQLAIVGRTVPLSRIQRESLAAVLQPALSSHPWPNEIGTGHFGGGDTVAITRVEPTVVVEVSADTALQGGRFRHPLRFVRHRPDLQPDDVPPMGASGVQLP
jgi:ATP-dependent DNA ligase